MPDPKSSPPPAAALLAAGAAIGAAHLLGLYLLYRRGSAAPISPPRDGEGGKKEEEEDDPMGDSPSPSPPASSSGGGGGAPPSPKYLLAGDIGGTNSRLALYEPGSRHPSRVREYVNSDVLTSVESTFADCVVLPFLEECFSPKGGGGEGGGVGVGGGGVGEGEGVGGAGLEVGDVIACLACAGPVLSDNRVVMTNVRGLHLTDLREGQRYELAIDGGALESSDVGLMRCVARCALINDFVGQGYGSLDLDLSPESADVAELIPGSRRLAGESEGGAGPRACVGAGTGLGECYLTRPPSRTPGPSSVGYECHPSEGGHVDYAPRSDLEIDLLRHLKGKFGSRHRVSVERVVSGEGLANVYEFLARRYPDEVDEEVHGEFLRAGDLRGRVVGLNSAPGSGRALCVRAMEIMMGAYGSEVGSAALKYMPTGGMYVTGGLTPKNIEWMRGEDSAFLGAYKDKGRVSGVLDTVPLFAVLAEDLGLRGARVCAQREYDDLFSE